MKDTAKQWQVHLKKVCDIWSLSRRRRRRRRDSIFEHLLCRQVRVLQCDAARLRRWQFVSSFSSFFFSPGCFRRGGGSAARAAARRSAAVDEPWTQTWWRPNSGGWGSEAVGPGHTHRDKQTVWSRDFCCSSILQPCLVWVLAAISSVGDNAGGPVTSETSWLRWRVTLEGLESIDLLQSLSQALSKGVSRHLIW